MPAPIYYTPIDGFSGAASSHPLFLRWREMKKRCSNKRSASYKYYGGKGITVCSRWLDFGLFVADMGLPPAADYSIEREDSNGNYEPGNCTWATTKKQSNNKSSSVFVEINGERLTVAEWAAKHGVSPNLYWPRINKLGWDPVDAVTMPAVRGKRYSTRKK